MTLQIARCSAVRKTGDSVQALPMVCLRTSAFLCFRTTGVILTYSAKHLEICCKKNTLSELNIIPYAVPTPPTQFHASYFTFECSGTTSLHVYLQVLVQQMENKRVLSIVWLNMLKYLAEP